MKKFIVFLLFFLFFFCSKETQKEDDFQNHKLEIERVILTDGEIFNPEDILKVQCKKDEECLNFGKEYSCNCEGECIPAECKEDKNCGGGKYCDPCEKKCMVEKKLCEPCTKDYQCEGDLSYCLPFEKGGSYCGLWCISACPQGFLCKEVEGLKDKQCIPASGECEKPEECKKDTDCPFGKICNVAKGLCYEGCKNDYECPEGNICSMGKCSPSCDKEKNPCPEGQECVDGHCKIIGGCLSPYDCPQPETYCDPEEKKCKPGCVFDFDCKSSAKMCLSGKCVKKGCTGNFWCAFGEVCNLQTKECVKAEGKFCEPCNPKQENSCGAKDILCITIQDKDGKEKGSFCSPPCFPDPENQCPQGYECAKIKDEKGNLVGEVCFRDCTIKPVGM